MIRTKYGKISDIKETANGVVYVKVESDGEMIGGTVPDTTAGQDTLPSYIIKPRIFKTSPDANAGVKIASDSVVIAGSPNTRIITSQKYGNILLGSTSIIAHPEAIRIGGVYRFNGLLTSTVPSSIVTPVSTLKIDLPGDNLIKILNKIKNDFERLVSL